MNATKTPTSGDKVMDSERLPNSIASLIFRRAAPPMTGMDIKKENSPAVFLETPIHMDKAIVDPDLETPGKIATP